MSPAMKPVTAAGLYGCLHQSLSTTDNLKCTLFVPMRLIESRIKLYYTERTKQVVNKSLIIIAALPT